MRKPRIVTPSHNERPWPLLGVLLLAVAVPTACVLWFMVQAVRNERLAVRQRLTDVYHNHLEALSLSLEDSWKDKRAALKPASAESPAATFARLVRSAAADSVVVRSSAGQVAYPAETPKTQTAEVNPSGTWRHAEEIEFKRGDPLAAAAAWLTIADAAEDADPAARALLAQVRCLAKAGQTDVAVEILTTRLRDGRFHNATDGYGNRIVARAHLFAVEISRDTKAPSYRATIERLAGVLNDYQDTWLPADQRRFLMQRLRDVVPDPPYFPTFEAEMLAANYVEAVPNEPATSRVTPTGLPDVWQLSSDDGTIVALFREDRLRREMQAVIDAEMPLPGAFIQALPPAEERSAAPFLTLDAGASLPGWTLALHLDGPDPFATAASRQVALYVWTGLVAVVAVAALSGLAAWHVGRQIRLTRLKNDLLATVSHELKTPLSSIRALADTLLEGKCPSADQRREYLALIARENERLSRLIDNFLAFSRIERNRRSFEFAEVRVADCVESALESERDKFAAPGCRLDVEVARDLPPVVGDADALATVLTNLLDNAYKYSGDEKHVVLRAYAENDAICLEVQDNGIGLSHRTARKIFDHFYQVDRSLSRTAGGCGLGLSIVRFIVDAHGGSVSVKSQPGVGSTFRVTLSAAIHEKPIPSKV